ncbi:hypothetical protein ACN42_g11754 [Penicillium freii]|uniref:Uncharacterized protein n=1 Tax=Penicillium freii TaxID=48697 RepID=A0A101M7S0_PENFR|nr:hypothetical protein ACN42_g11754 [Penicillium freii]
MVVEISCCNLSHLLCVLRWPARLCGRLACEIRYIRLELGNWPLAVTNLDPHLLSARKVDPPPIFLRRVTQALRAFFTPCET